MNRYFVKAPVSGWHEVDREMYERFIKHLEKDATPSIPMEELIRERTKLVTDDTPGKAV